jgi:hypothetical protein
MRMPHGSLRSVRQTLHAVLMEQAAHFRLMRNHLVPPFVLSVWRREIGARSSL